VQRPCDPITLDELGSCAWAFKYAASVRCSEHAVSDVATAAVAITALAAAAPVVASVVMPQREGTSGAPELGELVYMLTGIATVYF
jgi:hypothetical protein